MINVGALRRPFDSMLRVRENGQTERRVVDLPETFNFLIGLRVRTRRAFRRERNGGQHRVLVFRGKVERNQETVVIWRDIEGWSEGDFDEERAWVREQGIIEGGSASV